MWASELFFGIVSISGVGGCHRRPCTVEKALRDRLRLAEGRVPAVQSRHRDLGFSAYSLRPVNEVLNARTDWSRRAMNNSLCYSESLRWLNDVLIVASAGGLCVVCRQQQQQATTNQSTTNQPSPVELYVFFQIFGVRDAEKAITSTSFCLKSMFFQRLFASIGARACDLWMC